MHVRSAIESCPTHVDARGVRAWHNEAANSSTGIRQRPTRVLVACCFVPGESIKFSMEGATLPVHPLFRGEILCRNVD